MRCRTLAGAAARREGAGAAWAADEALGGASNGIAGAAGAGGRARRAGGPERAGLARGSSDAVVRVGSAGWTACAHTATDGSNERPSRKSWEGWA